MGNVTLGQLDVEIVYPDGATILMSRPNVDKPGQMTAGLLVRSALSAPLTAATAEALGSVKQGAGTEIAADGTLSIAAALAGLESRAQKNIPNGYAGLDGAGRVGWAQLPAALRLLPLGFCIPGKPGPGAKYNLVMAAPAQIPDNLAGTAVYADGLASANAVCTVNHVSAAGVVAPLGTITITPDGHTSALLSAQAGSAIPAGDVLQLVMPGTPDATLADIGITVLAMRV